MTVPPDGPLAEPPASTFQVIHYLRPAAGSGWSQSTSAELSGHDAIAWIDNQAGDAAALGFRDGPAVTPADPAAAIAADTVTPSAPLSQPADAVAPQLGDS